MTTETKPPAKRRPPIPLIVLGLGLLSYGCYRVYLERKPYEWSGTVEADVYSLGAVLYQLWTGKTPSRASSFEEAGREHERELERPRALVPFTRRSRV